MNLPRKWTEEELEKVKTLRFSGMSFGKIAREFGTTANTVLSVWYRKIAKVTFPSDSGYHKGGVSQLDEETRLRPSLPFVPGLNENQKYRLVRFDYERLG